MNDNDEQAGTDRARAQALDEEARLLEEAKQMAQEKEDEEEDAELGYHSR